MENMYCIAGIIAASKKFSRDPEAQVGFEQEIKELHVPESLNLVSGGNLLALLSQRVMSHCVQKVFYAIVGEYQTMGYESSEKCFACTAICH